MGDVSCTMGLDVKVVTAVFLTLLGVAVAMGAGQFSADEFSLPDFSLDQAGDLTDMFQPGVENGSITVDGNLFEQGTRSLSVAPTTVSVFVKEGTDVTVNNMDFTLSQTQRITLNRFHGDIRFGQGNLSLSGDTKWTRIGGTVSVNDTHRVALNDVEISRITLDQVAGKQFRFTASTGSFTVDTGNTSKDVSLDEEDIIFHNYRGGFTVNPGVVNATGDKERNGTWSYTLEGNVTQVALPDSKITIG